MRVTLSALLAAALTSGFALAQLPTLVPGDLEGRSFAATQQTIHHYGSNAGFESSTLPGETEYGTLPIGPQCPHWPLFGVGSAYSFKTGLCGTYMTYEGKDRVVVPGGQFGRIDPHMNRVSIYSPLLVPGFVDVHMKSITDAESWAAYAAVQIADDESIVHRFSPVRNGLGETVVTLPVEVGPNGLQIYVLTFAHVENMEATAPRGLVDIDVKVMFRLPSAAYVTGGIGCTSSNGVPTIRASAGALPALGSVFDAEIINLPDDPGMFAFGLLGTELLQPPVSLGVFGKPGCTLYVADPIAVLLPKVGDTAIWSLRVPPNLALVDAKFVQQAFAFDNKGNELDFVLSNYGMASIGIMPVALP